MNAIRQFRTMSLFHKALLLDLATGIPTAALLIAGADALAPLLGLSAALLRNAGFVLLPFAALLALTLAAVRPHKFAAWSIIEINLAWVAASFYVLYGAGLQATAVGEAVVIAQALAVLGIAALQFAGWRAFGTASGYEGSVATRA
jgi:hypothetical protein